jgi:hypothetical protein
MEAEGNFVLGPQNKGPLKFIDARLMNSEYKSQDPDE